MWYSSKSREENYGRMFSDAQFPLIGAQLAYLAISGRDGRTAAWKGAQSVAVTGAITLTIKKTFKRRRPYPNDNQFGTFPSGHTSLSFAMAGVMGAAEPRLRLPAMMAASAVGWSRVKVRAHHWQDVLAGAALGLVVSNQFKPDRKVNGPLANISLKF
ncbi:phosphatase PAP2 family protein [bacterium]|nr:MAG: phosphatase PAP2 family protein [bacterium]